MSQNVEDCALLQEVISTYDKKTQLQLILKEMNTAKN